MEDNKTIYFYKIPYYEKKLNTDIDIICRLENNNIVIDNNAEHRVLLDSYKKYMEGYNVLSYLHEKYNINHNDIWFNSEKDNLKDYMENYSKTRNASIKESILKLQKSNMYISNNKCIIIDFEFACRFHNIFKGRNTHERMLELDTE